MAAHFNKAGAPNPTALPPVTQSPQTTTLGLKILCGSQLGQHEPTDNVLRRDEEEESRIVRHRCVRINVTPVGRKRVRKHRRPVGYVQRHIG